MFHYFFFSSGFWQGEGPGHKQQTHRQKVKKKKKSFNIVNYHKIKEGSKPKSKIKLKNKKQQLKALE